MRRKQYVPDYSVVVMHRRRRISADAQPCHVGEHIQFDADILRSYITRRWDPVVYDALLLAATIEFCDRKRVRPRMDWPRHFRVSLPVHEPSRWQDPAIRHALQSALVCLTGDRWSFEFRQKREPVNSRPQEWLQFPPDIEAVVPFSDGLDSMAVSAILERQVPGELIRVRVGACRKKPARGQRPPFSAIPFKVTMKSRAAQEGSRRSRGFKFSMVAGLAAYLARADSVIVPESGQGAIGPVLVNVGHAHPDRRTHPQFTVLITQLLQALLGPRIEFRHPTLWGTKGETLTRYRAMYPESTAWRLTRSCWQDARQTSVDGSLRQCGVCAACLIRRVSLFVAGYEDSPDAYVWRHLDARSLWQGADRRFRLRHEAQREYALAGVLHMDHLASLERSAQFGVLVDRQALVLANSLGLSFDVARDRVVRLLDAHRNEWQTFLRQLPETSFVRRWAEMA